MQDQPDSLVTEIFHRIIKGEVLSDRDITQYQGILLDMALSNKMPPNELKKRIEKFRQAIPNFLRKLEEDLKEMVKINEKLFKMAEEQHKLIASLPKYVNSHDAPELIKFARSLDKEYYSFSEAERLVNVARQTLKKYAQAGSYGLKEYMVGRTTKLHKADIIKFYRVKNFKDYLPF